MSRVCFVFALSLFGMLLFHSAELQADDKKPVVVMKTSLGDIVIELDAEKAPVTVENFLRYVDETFYEGLIFHRVIPDFMIQGGGLDRDLNKKETHPPIKNEAKNGLKNLRGTIAMARTAQIDSATAQFFINVKDNPFLDHQPGSYGYAVFGQVTEGMDVVDKIVSVETTTVEPHRNVPVEPIFILSVERK